MVLPYLTQVYEQTRSSRSKRSRRSGSVSCVRWPRPHLVDLMGAVQRRNHGIELQILDASARELQERLLKGDLEVALYCLAGGEQDDRLHALDSCHDRGRARLRLLRESHRRRRSAACRARVLARSRSGDCPRAPILFRRRSVGARSDANPVVRPASDRGDAREGAGLRASQSLNSKIVRLAVLAP